MVRWQCTGSGGQPRRGGAVLPREPWRGRLTSCGLRGAQGTVGRCGPWRGDVQGGCVQQKCPGGETTSETGLPLSRAPGVVEVSRSRTRAEVTVPSSPVLATLLLVVSAVLLIAPPAVLWVCARSSVLAAAFTSSTAGFAPCEAVTDDHTLRSASSVRCAAGRAARRAPLLRHEPCFAVSWCSVSYRRGDQRRRADRLRTGCQRDRARLRTLRASIPPCGGVQLRGSRRDREMSALPGIPAAASYAPAETHTWARLATWAGRAHGASRGGFRGVGAVPPRTGRAAGPSPTCGRR
ncbi:hypothetical protein SAMN05421806_105428 [Streptomyces indicus]|uniref:Uncharacterized protein n=1 Tax=Streptomyces indicus TaxID=417292 RepID=A0A1G9A8Q3_9ACTN|nr:hypothetical protein SAMN05421806_105428 [Streptomyces indicus]